MADALNVSQNPNKDTSPLAPEQLSRHELDTIFDIERRIYEVQQYPDVKINSKKDEDRYLATFEDRYRRALLLDGPRGTGKTSMLLTLVERWRRGIGDDEEGTKRFVAAYGKRIKTLQTSYSPEIPSYIRVLPILDFDPLPPEMPLIAGIVEAWRPLAKKYDKLSGQPDECADEDGTLMDRWHRLFRVAAVGWTPISHKRGLIEEVLDRQEQVQDWKHLADDWRSFVDEVVKRGKCIKGVDRLPDPVFVIMIDDVDLQVERIRELLPALRLLYHPRVVFLVAAHRPHMIDMLTLAFLGQQNTLAKGRIGGNTWRVVNDDRWAADLAESSFQKVFSLRNRWSLRALPLREVLEFPDHAEKTLKTVLDAWPQQRKEPPFFGSLGDYLLKMAGPPGDPAELPAIMSYRTVDQIGQQVLAEDNSQKNASQAIVEIIGGFDSNNLVKITNPDQSSEGDVIQSAKKKESRLRHKVRPKETDGPRITYLATGKLASFFPRVFTEELSSQEEIVLSARPHFVYRHDDSDRSRPVAGIENKQTRKTSAMIAVSLRDDGYGLVAPGLQWDVRLALVWTRVRLLEDLAFQWNLHEHPSPLRLLSWTKEWHKFIEQLSGNTEDRRERIAYAWIYYQLYWLSSGDPKERMKNFREPFDKMFNTEQSWKELLTQEPQTGKNYEKARWKTETLPLLARPELGLPVKVQERLLNPNTTGPLDKDRLRDQRRRLVTDAILTAAEEVGAQAEQAENEERVDKAIEAFEKRHGAQQKRAQGKGGPRGRDDSLGGSPWFKTIGNGST